MPLFYAAVIAARSGRRSPTVIIPVRTPPLWRMLAEETVIAAGHAVARLGRWVGWHDRPA